MVPLRLLPRLLSNLWGVGRTLPAPPVLQTEVDLCAPAQVPGDPPPAWISSRLFHRIDLDFLSPFDNSPTFRYLKEMGPAAPSQYLALTDYTAFHLPEITKPSFRWLPSNSSIQEEIQATSCNSRPRTWIPSRWQGIQRKALNSPLPRNLAQFPQRAYPLNT